MEYVAHLLGGPSDGEVHVLQHRANSVRVKVIDFEVLLGNAILTLAKSKTSFVPTKVAIYNLETEILIDFGQVRMIFVYAGTTEEVEKEFEPEDTIEF